MNTKENYIEPQVEVIEIEVTESIMNASLGVSDTPTDEISRSKRKGFWNEE